MSLTKNLINTTFGDLINLIKQYMRTRTDLVRLTVVEAITAIVGITVVCVFAAVMGAVALAFVSLAIVHVLCMWLPTWASYLIMTAFIALVALLGVAFKNKLIYNPLARVISKRILRKPIEP